MAFRGRKRTRVRWLPTVTSAHAGFALGAVGTLTATPLYNPTGQTTLSPLDPLATEITIHRIVGEVIFSNGLGASTVYWGIAALRGTWGAGVTMTLNDLTDWDPSTQANAMKSWWLRRIQRIPASTDLGNQQCVPFGAFVDIRPKRKLHNFELPCLMTVPGGNANVVGQLCLRILASW